MLDIRRGMKGIAKRFLVPRFHGQKILRYHVGDGNARLCRLARPDLPLPRS
jgi:hypothetical protein